MGQGKPGPGAWVAPCAVLAAAAVVAALIGADSAARAGESRGRADTELASLRDFLVGSDRTPATRRDAAEVLLNKDASAARAILVEVLSGPTPSEPTLAVLDVIASHDAVHEAFLDPLLLLLRSDDDSTRRAAALAFGAFQGSDKALARLKEAVTAADTAPAVRLAAIQALSQIMDRRSIETLVQVATDAKRAEAPAAAAALADMTGLKDLGTSAEAWQSWWARHQADPEPRLLAGLLRHSREDVRQRDATLDRLQARLIRHLNDLYEAADAKEKGRLALGHLEDSAPQVRAVGARQAAAMAQAIVGGGNGGSRQPYQDLLAALLKRVNDEAPTVRAAAAEALAAWKEASAGPVLLGRLDIEKVPEVRASLAVALGGLKVVEAVPKLVAMLDSPSEVEVLRAAAALGSLGEKNASTSPAVEAAAKPLGRLARAAPQPTVREAAGLALARMGHPSAEGILVAALDDATASVRFSAAQGLGNLGKAAPKTVQALAAHLQDENKGVRQAVAAALAKLGGPAEARQMADRLKAGGEAEPAVRNALWAAILGLVELSTGSDLALELGDRFMAREGVEEMQRAAAMYQAAVAKLPAAAQGTQAAAALHERIVDAHVAAGTPEGAVPSLRQLLAITPADNVSRLRDLNRQLSLLLLPRDPAAEAVPPLAAAMDGADAETVLALGRAIQVRTEALLKADRPEPALELVTAFRRARPDGGGPDVAEALKTLAAQAADAAAAQAVAKLNGPDDQASAAAATLKKVGRPAVGRLLDALEAAARDKQAALEARLLGVLEAVTGRKDHGYSPTAPLDDRLRKVAAWRQAP